MSTQGIDLRNIFLEAKKDFSKGNFDAALRKWQKIFLKLRNMDNTEGMAEILYNIAMVQKKLGQFQESIINLKETLEMYQFLRNDERVALVLYTLGLIHSEIGKLEIAWRYLEEASILFQADNNVEYLSKIIFEIGNINLMKNDLEPSRENFLKCIEFQEQLGDEISKGKCYYSLSLLEIIGKNTSKANEYLEKAATIFNEANFFEGKIKIKSVEGLLALRGNDIQKAEKIFKECTKLIADKYIRLPASSGMIEKQEEVQILLYMGDLFIKDSKLNLPDIGKTLNLKAYDYFKDAKEISEKIGYKKGIGQTSFQMAMILFNRGIQEDLKKSAELFRYSLEMAKSIKDNELITRCLLYLGINYRRIYQYDEGLTFLQDCFIFSRKLNYHELEARSLIEKHRILYQVGKLDEALSTLHAAREIAENHADLRNLLANIYFLLGVFHFEVGEIKESSDFLSRSRSIFVELDNKSGIIKILFEFARLNEEQGYLTHSIQYLDEIENIFQERSQIKDISRIRIKKGKLYFLKGNSEKSLEILGKEISYLEGIRVSGRDALVTEAKLVIYNILKNSGKVFEANEIFNDIFSFFNKNEKLLELFDIFLNLTYESLEDGKYEIIKPAINKIWGILKGSKEDLDYRSRLVKFLHVQGLIYQHDGNIDLSRKYFNECLMLIQKIKLGHEEGIILAQLGDLSLIESKADAINLFNQALKKLTVENNIKDIIKIKLKIGILLYYSQTFDEAIKYILEAVKNFEDTFILMKNLELDMEKEASIHFYTDKIPIHALLSSLYLEKYLAEKDENALKRSMIALQFQKIYGQHLEYFKKQIFNMYSCKAKAMEKFIETDNNLYLQALMKQKRLNFFLKKKLFHDNLLISKNFNKDYTKTRIDFVSKKINTEYHDLSEILKELKKNRVNLMNCKDPGSFVPFLGFDLIKHSQKYIKGLENAVFLDIGVFLQTSKIALFLYQDGKIEVFTVEIDESFFESLHSLRIAIMQHNAHEILFYHQKLTTFLFPRDITSYLKENGLKTIFICTQDMLNDVNFNLLGENNDLGLEFIFSYVPTLLNLKILTMDDGANKRSNDSLDFYIMIPDNDEPSISDDIVYLSDYFKGNGSNKIESGNTHQLLEGSKAIFASFMDISEKKPSIIHFIGTLFLPNSLPFKGFFNLNDRAFFFENLLELDIQERKPLLCCTGINEFSSGMNEIQSLWRTLSLTNIPNLIISTSNQGMIGKFYVSLYNHLIKGLPLGEAYHETLKELSQFQEISPLTWGNHILAANPAWKLR